MKQSEAKEFLPLIQAWADGKTIQFRDHSGKWEDVADRPMNFCEDVSAYRIKPEPVLRPWTEADAIAIAAQRVTILYIDPKSGLKTTGVLGVEDGVWDVGGRDIPEGLEFLCRNSVIASTGAPCGVME